MNTTGGGLGVPAARCRRPCARPSAPMTAALPPPSTHARSTQPPGAARSAPTSTRHHHNEMRRQPILDLRRDSDNLIISLAATMKAKFTARLHDRPTSTTALLKDGFGPRRPNNRRRRWRRSPALPAGRRGRRSIAERILSGALSPARRWRRARAVPRVRGLAHGHPRGDPLAGGQGDGRSAAAASGCSRSTPVTGGESLRNLLRSSDVDYAKVDAPRRAIEGAAAGVAAAQVTPADATGNELFSMLLDSPAATSMSRGDGGAPRRGSAGGGSLGDRGA